MKYGFDPLKQNYYERELLGDELLTDVDLISLVNANKKNVDSEESDSEESVVQINKNLILSMDPNTEKTMKIECELTDLFSGYHELHRQLKNSKSQSLITDYIPSSKRNN